MKHIMRSRLFWIILTIISISLTALTIHFFPKAFPIVHVDLTMDRNQALTQAAEISHTQKLGPDDYSHAIQFSTDDGVKTFVELEGGGKDAFIAMIEHNLYIPYTWQIRHFKEFETNEVEIRFTPDGKPYGFTETIAENSPGAHLTKENARERAEKTAAQFWNIDFTQFKLIEASQETRQTGRIDHTFIYERNNARIREGSYRLRLVMTGDKLSDVTRYIKIPESFTLRYQEIRSYNDSLASGASMLMIVLYIIGGCIIALSFLARKRWLIWRTPMICALIVAFLQLLANLNQFPLLWMYYETSLPYYTFIINQLIRFALGFVVNFLSMALIFAAAETLGRKAFGHHLQLWRVWSEPAVSSLQVFGQTVGGYLLVATDFAFVVFFYLFTTRCCGWWIPSDELINPNILATYFPWLSSIAQSLMAGFQEECLFRAVPLACAALIGQRFGKRNWWIFGAFILQALIFGAAHANYPAQPAYARLIELIVPSFVFGGLYLAFGLLPGIVLHFAIDVIWFALPIFVSSAPYAIINKLIVVVLTLIPLAIVCIALIKKKGWHNATQANYNSAWEPQEAETPKSAAPIKTTSHILFSKESGLLVGTVGIIGLLLWLFAAPFKQDSTSLCITRTQAITQAKEIIKKDIDPELWTAAIYPHITFEQTADEEAQHRFIWKEGKKELYANLLGNYLMPPAWLVRFVKFDGSVEERAEEYQILIAQPESAMQVNHKIPESAHGAHLTENQARTLAHKALHERLHLDPQKLQEITVTPVKTSKSDRLDVRIF